MEEFPKILIGAPTSQTKDYCWLEFICNLKSIDYPADRMHIMMVDNSSNNFYAKYLKGFGISVYHVNPKEIIDGQKKPRLKPLVEIVCESHNVLREYAVKNKFDYLFHTESDVMIKPATLKQLLLYKKKIVSAMYFHGNDLNTNLLLQCVEDFGMHRKVRRLSFEETVHFIDGSVKKIHACGIGAALIHKSILKNFEFRFADIYGRIDKEMYPDSYLYEDLAREEIDAFVDTNIILEHRSQDWAINLDFYR